MNDTIDPDDPRVDLQVSPSAAESEGDSPEIELVERASTSALESAAMASSGALSFEAEEKVEQEAAKEDLGRQLEQAGSGSRPSGEATNREEVGLDKLPSDSPAGTEIPEASEEVTATSDEATDGITGPLAAELDGESAEEEDDKQYQTSARNSVAGSRAGRDITLIGTQQIVDDGDGDGFLQLAQEEWALLEPFLVPSESCRTFCPDPDAGRLLMVLGPEHSGKRATALYLASRLGFLSMEHSEVLIYRPAAHSRQVSLHDLVNRKEFSPGSLLLFEDAFRVGISPIEVKSLHSLQSQLAERKAFLILTSELHTRDLPEDIFRVSAQLEAAQLKEVLTLALDQALPSGTTPPREELEAWIGGSWPSLVRTLDAPFKIHRFCRRLSDRLSEEPALEKEQLGQLAQEAIDPGPLLLRKWFQDLEGNGQLLAFLIVFFPDLFKSNLISLYQVLVEWLRHSVPDLFQDPRDQGFEDMLVQLQAQTRNQLVQMETTHYQQEVRRQVANHVLMLRSVAELMLEKLQLLRGYESWPLRKGLGQLIGQIGLQDGDWLKVTIDRLAQDKNWQYRTIASYALAPIVAIDLERRTSRVVDLLRGWCKVENPDLRWTAGSGIWQVYKQMMSEQSRSFHRAHLEGLKDKLLDLLRLLSIHRQGSSLFPMTHILRSFSEEVAPMLTPWMVCDTDWRDLVIEAMEKVLEAPMAARLPALPHLLCGLLASASPVGGRSRRIFENLREWIAREDLAEGVLRCLLEVAHRGDARQRSRLRQALSRSWQGKHRSEEIASRVAARTWALDGRWSRLPSEAAGLLVLDPQGASEAYGEIYRHIQMVLSSRMALRVSYLGDVESWTTASSPRVRKGSRRARPRLLMPLIEECTGDEIRRVIVLAAGPILDIDDLAGPLEPQVLLLAFGDRSLPPQGLHHSFSGVFEHLREHAGESNVNRVDEALNRVLGGTEGEGEPTGCTPSTLALPAKGCLLGLSDPDGAAGPKDLLGGLCAALIHESERDLEAALSVLATWFSESRVAPEEGAETGAEPRQERPIVARAMARSLLQTSIRVFHRERTFPPTRLFDGVVEVLAQHDSDNAGLVLKFLQVCLESSEWAAYLAGNRVAGRGRLFRFLRSNLPDQLPFFANILAEQTSVALEPLKAQFAEFVNDATPRETLPDLREGQRRALIFVDNEAGEKLWPAASGVARRLLERESEPDLVPSLFQLGSASPVWVPGSPWQPRATPIRPPRLLGVALENPDLRVEDTALILVLATGPILDREDWSASGWAKRIWIHSPGGRPTPRASGGGRAFRPLAAMAAKEPQELAQNLLNALILRVFESE